jgi:2-iminoacetate synthase ThiH
MFLSVGISLAALGISLVALYWSKKSAIAAGRSADAAEETARISREALDFSKVKAEEEKRQTREQWLNALVQQGVNDWPGKGSLAHIVLREPSLTEDEVHQLAQRVCDSVGYPPESTDRHFKQLLELRAKQGTRGR